MSKVCVLGSVEAGEKEIIAAVGCLVTSLLWCELQWVVLVMFLVPGTKYLIRSKLKRGRIYSVLQSKGMGHLCGEGMEIWA